MVKKKSNIKAPIIAGIGLTIVILTPLLLLFAGIEVPIIGEAYADALRVKIAPQGDPAGFEIPVIPQDEIDDLNDEVGDIIDQGGDTGFDEIDPNTGEIPDCVGVDNGLNPPACINDEPTDPNALTPEEIEDMIDEVVNEFDEMNPPPDLNMTETSNDPPIDQIIDDLEPPIIEPPTPKVKLLTNVVKIDATLNRFNSTTTTDVPALSFFVEDTTNIDFTNGFIEIKMEIETFPDSIVNGIGDFDILVGDQSILPQPLKVEVTGTTDENGRQTLFFISPTGARSEIFTFSFENEADKFPTTGITPIIFKANQFDITVGIDNEFRLGDNTLFAMTIATNPNEIVIIDEQGELVRLFPTDDRFIIRSSTIPVTGFSCLHNTYSGSGCIGSYCRLFNDPTHDSSFCTGSPTFRTVGTNPAPQISGINLFENGQFVKSITGGRNGIIFDEMLTRNTNYTITISDPPVTYDFTTPKSQKNYDFKCWAESTVHYGVTNSRCSGCALTTYANVCPNAQYCPTGSVPFTTSSAKECNFQ